MFAVSVCLTGTSWANDVTFTSDADFNEGTLDRVQVSSGSIRLQEKGTSLGSWSAGAALPQTLQDLKLAYYDGMVYVSGGWTGADYSKAVYYASPGGSWTTDPDSLPRAVRDHAMVIVNGHIYVLGGRQDGAPTDTVYFSEIDYDKSLRPWEVSAAALPQPLWGHAALTYAGFVYVIGGTNQSTEGTALDSVYFATVNADGTLGSWTTTTNLPSPRNHHAAVVTNGTVYVTGGYDGTGTSQNTIYFAEVNSDGSLSSWDSTTALPVALYGHSATVENGLLTVIGGVIQGTPDRSQDTVYTAALNSDGTLGIFSVTTHYAMRVSHGACVSTPGRVYSVGGQREPAIVYDNVYYADFATSSNTIYGGTYLSAALDCGTVATIESVAWNATLNGQSISFRYRSAGADRIWSGWSSTSSTSPIAINTAGRYVQYQVFLASDNSATPIVEDVTVTVDGVTFVCGTISSGTWTAAYSPYVALCDLTLSSGRLDIDPGVTVKFKSGYGLEIGAAELYAWGSSSEPVVFTSLSDETDHWTGIYFNSNSGKIRSPEAASTMTFCEIRNAGQGSRNANLYCYATTQPSLHRCHITQATGYGIYLTNGDISLTESTIDSCAEIPLYCSNGSSASLEDCTVDSDNDPAIFCTGSSPTITFTGISGDSIGIYCENSSPIVQANTIHDNSAYGVYMSGNSCPELKFNTYLNNGLYNITVGGGDISSDGTWYVDGVEPYVVLGDVIVNRINSPITLTIEPGLVVKFSSDAGLQIGQYTYNHHSPGGLYAVGTIDSMITFTSLSGQANDWDGIYFHDKSDYNGAVSTMSYCVVENAGQVGWGVSANVYCNATTQPTMTDCVIKNSGGSGVYLYDGDITITNCTVDSNAVDGIGCIGGSDATVNNCEVFDNGQYGIYCNSSVPLLDSNIVYHDSIGIYCENSSPIIQGNTIHDNSAYGVYMVSNSCPELKFNTYYGNGLYNIAVGGGVISSDGAWYVDGEEPYIVLGGVVVRYSVTPPTLTIEPGLVIKFDTQAGLRIGRDDGSGYWPGQLYAVGTVDSVITFTSLSGATNDWDGIYFDPHNDYYGAVSTLSNCVIEKAGQPGWGVSANIYCYASTQPTMADCVIKNSGGTGVYLNNGDITMTNCTVDSNAVDGVGCYNGSNATIDSCELSDNWIYGLMTSNSSPILRNSQIIDNDSCGVFCEGSSQPIIGDTMGLTCGLYNNGSFDLYNNTANTILARYNFWGQPDSAGIEERIYHCDDDPSNGCVLFSPWSSVDHDVRALYILAPADSVVLDSLVTPQAVVKNVGKNTETFPVVFQIASFYADTVVVNSLPPGDSQVVSFTDWLAGPAGTYNPLCFTELDGDQWQAYDTTAGFFYIAPPGSQPEIYSISPDVSGNSGIVVATITGNRFQPGASAKLTKSGEPDIVGYCPITYVIDSTIMIVVFDLYDGALGSWNLVVTNPDGGSTTFYNGFTIEVGHNLLWVNIVGRDQIRAGRTNSITVVFGNSGNVDEPAWIILWLPRELSVRIPISDTLEYTYDPDRLPPEYLISDTVVLGVVIEDLSAGSSRSFEMLISAPDSWPASSLFSVGASIFPQSLHGEENEMAGSPGRLMVFAGQDPEYEITGQIWEGWVNRGEGGLDAWEYLRHGVTILPIFDEVGNVVGHEAYSQITGVDGLDRLLKDSPAGMANLIQSQGSENFLALRDGQVQLTREEIDNYRGRLEYYRLNVTAYYSTYFWKKFDWSPPVADCIGWLEQPAEKAGIRGGKGFIDPFWERIWGGSNEARFAEAFGIELEPFPIRFSEPFPFVIDILRLARPQHYVNFPPSQSHKSIEVITSWDPNDKVGPSGFGDSSFVLPEELFHYTIYFENVDSATADADSIWIVDSLGEHLDWSTLELGEIFPGAGPDNIRPDFNSVVNFDPVSGEISWGLYDINLPPDTAPYWGEGWVSYSINPKDDLPTGTRIENVAAIKFDVNDWILAPMDSVPIVNTIDAGLPSSNVIPDSLSDTTGSTDFIVYWTGSDDPGGSGIASYSVFVSTDSSWYDPWITDTTATSATYEGINGKTYYFYCIARDNVGHVEPTPETYDVKTVVYFSCCVDYRGNANCSEIEDPDISDITRLIDFLYLSHNPLCCEEEADANGSGGEPDISDITKLIDHLYLTHSELAPCP